jgi:hypothetical protein
LLAEGSYGDLNKDAAKVELPMLVLKIEAALACSDNRGNPNMNSLIGLGALTSFAAGVAAPLVPGMAFDASFLEEPVMLLAFVLLGRSLEARARLKASGAVWRASSRALLLTYMPVGCAPAHGTTLPSKHW